MLLWRQSLVGRANFCQSLFPCRRQELVIFPDQRCCQSLSPQAVTSEACLVIDPLFVDIVVEPGKYSHHLHASCIYPDIGTHCVEHVYGLDMKQLPRPSSEGIWF